MPQTLPSEFLSSPGLPAPDLAETSDAASGTSTIYTIGVGDRFEGVISSAADNDWVRVSLVAGESYVFRAWGIDNGLTNSTLTLRDSSGNQLSYNDNIDSSNKFSLLEFTAATSGTYYLQVDGYSSTVGSYALDVATNVLTPEQVAVELTEIGWGLPYPLSFDAVAGDVITVNLTGLTAAGQQLASWALEAWSTLTGLIFSTVSSGGQITFDDNQPGAMGGASAYWPGSGEIVTSMVNVASSWLSQYGTSIDSYSMTTYLHEIGHALGLSHSGHYDGSANFSEDAYYLNDSRQMSVMSYFSVGNNPNVTGSNGYPLTPMPADIVAIQQLYGSAPSIQGGDTVWGANSTVGGYMDLLFGQIFGTDPANAAIYGGGLYLLTIVDSGGSDLLDVSTRSEAAQIDLRSGAVSSIGGLINNVIISAGTVIERVATGSGADQIIGNAADNDIYGGAGNDTIYGGGGADRLYGGDGADTLEGGTGNDAFYGGAGSDTVILAVNSADISAREESGGIYITSALGEDFFSGVEMVRFNDGTFTLDEMLTPGMEVTGAPKADTLSGDSGADTIRGLAGDDTLHGNAGHDTLYGGLGWDVIHGGPGDDTILGQDGADTLFGGDGDDSINGGNGNDTIHGDAGADNINGGLGWDTIYGGADDDTVIGLEGWDRIYGDAGNDTLDGNSGFDEIYGGDGNDTIRGGQADDLIYGGAGADLLSGDSGWDRIYGDAGADILYGNAGSDRLNGGAGNDTLYGGLGADVFIFEPGSGSDRVMDMGLADRLEIAGSLLGSGATAEDLRGYATAGGGLVVFDFGNGDVLTIAGSTNLDFLISHTDLI